ncbi:hypothetical protein BGZ94_002430 [Podila epigama]|nr:hypothetical protein BGZ94_002430 [Podila epigama]
MSGTTTPSVPTNTITITNLEAHHFEAEPLAKLRTLVDTFGPVHFFSPIKSFHRVFVVYKSEFDAQRAKTLLHNTAFDSSTIIRVYFGQHTELTIDPAKYYLHLPHAQQSQPHDHQDDLSLVSPPGSPPLGHTDIVSDDMEILVLDESETDIIPSIQEPHLATATADAAVTTLTTTTTTALAPATSTSSPSSTSTTTTSSSSSSTTSSQNRLEQRIRGLRINTVNSSTPRRFPLSPISPSGGSSSNLLLPTTPTLLAFSPSEESVGEQPFITIQDWGMEDVQTPSVSCH